MNIWILTNDYYPSYGLGLAGYMEQVGRMFVQGGHYVTIFVRDPEKNIVEEKTSGLRIVRFYDKGLNNAPDLDYYVANSWQIAEVVLAQIDQDKAAPDLIEVQDCMALGYYLLQKKWQGDRRLKNIPVTILMHTPRFELLHGNRESGYQMPDYLIGRLEKNCFLAADGLLCPSNFLKDKLQPYAGKKTIKVIPLPFELTPAELPAATALKSNIDILYTGALEYRKGIISFLEETDKAWQQGLNFNCMVVGKSYPLKEKKCEADSYLKVKHHKHILQNKLKITGQVPKDILYELISRAKIVVVPSHYDNFPLGCLEAMSLGKPLLVSAQGGQAEMVGEDESCGLVFDWDKPGDVQRQLKRMLAYQDEQLKTMGQKASTKIKQMYNYKTILSQREKYYGELIDGQHPKKSYPIVNPFPRADVQKNNSSPALLSVVIAVHNPGKYFLETLKNALQSTYPSKEILIVNAATDDPDGLEQLEVIRKEKFPLIRILDADTESLAEARNLGAKFAQGEYLTFLDDHETIEKSYYTKAIQLLQSYDNVDYVYSWQRFYEKIDTLNPTLNTELPLLLYANTVGSTTVISRDLYLSHGLQNPEFEYGLEEHELWIRLTAAGFNGVCLPEELSFYRVTKNSLFLKTLQNANQRIALFEKMTKKHAQLYEKYATDLISLFLANYEKNAAQD